MGDAELKKEVRAWSRATQDRIGRDMESSFAELEKNISARIKETPLLDLIRGGAPKFTEEILTPEIEDWVERVTQPIMSDAQRTLQRIVAVHMNKETRTAFLLDGDNAMLMDVGATVLGLASGIGIMIAGVVAGITTFIWFFTVINWPLLIGGLVVGGLLAVMSSARAARLKDRIIDRVSDKLMPKIKDALIGEGYEHEGEKHPSLREELQRSIREVAKRAEAGAA